jgi:HEAT repeat protein
VLRVISALRRMALPFLAVRSADASAEVRFWATYLLGDLHYPDAATALWPRLFDEDGSVRRVAAHSARALVTSSEVGAPIRAGLDRVVRNSGEPEARRLLAVSMIGDLRLFSLVPTLIALLENAPLPIVTAAAQTLEAMTRQELGTDARRWSQWWAAKGRARFAT